MLLTEEDAKTKWCPMVRAPYGGYGSVNTYDKHFKCIASDCAMWRWSKLPAQGYCGLAGKPEIQE